MNLRIALALVCLCVLTHSSAPAQDVFGAKRVGVDLGANQGFVLVPPKPGPAGSRPWVWYAPVLGNNPSPNIAWMAKQLVDAGFYIVGVNVGESMGNPAGRAIYSKFYDHVVKEFGLEPKARLLAQSRGGLMLYNWAVENPSKVKCIAGVYPVGDLRSYPKLPRAAKEYGLTIEELEKILPDNNPVDRLEPLAKADIPILHIHGDADKLVPLEANSQTVYNRHTKFGGRMELIVPKGSGHKVGPEFFEDPRMVKFLLDGDLPKVVTAKN